MTRYAYLARSAALATLGVFGLTLASPVARAQVASARQGHAAPRGDSLQIPASIRAEHEEIQQALTAATKAPNPMGAAARALAAVLHPHFVREEQIALPPLSLLVPLARGDRADAMRAVLPLTDSLRAEMPRMLHEHEIIRAATLRLGNVARAQHNARVQRLAEQLALHAQSEEQVFYPAALLVGDLVRLRGAAGVSPR